MVAPPRGRNSSPAVRIRPDLSGWFRRPGRASTWRLLPGLIRRADAHTPATPRFPPIPAPSAPSCRADRFRTRLASDRRRLYVRRRFVTLRSRVRGGEGHTSNQGGDGAQDHRRVRARRARSGRHDGDRGQAHHGQAIFRTGRSRGQDIAAEVDRQEEAHKGASSVRSRSRAYRVRRGPPARRATRATSGESRRTAITRVTAPADARRTIDAPVWLDRLRVERLVTRAAAKAARSRSRAIAEARRVHRTATCRRSSASTPPRASTARKLIKPTSPSLAYTAEYDQAADVHGGTALSPRVPGGRRVTTSSSRRNTQGRVMRSGDWDKHVVTEGTACDTTMTPTRPRHLRPGRAPGAPVAHRGSPNATTTSPRRLVMSAGRSAAGFDVLPTARPAHARRPRRLDIAGDRRSVRLRHLRNGALGTARDGGPGRSDRSQWSGL